jgi:hypothetical protein
MFFENTSVGILKNTAKHKDRTKISNYFFRLKAETAYLHKACHKIKHTHFIVFPENRKLHLT